MPIAPGLTNHFTVNIVATAPLLGIDEEVILRFLGLALVSETRGGTTQESSFFSSSTIVLESQSQGLPSASWKTRFVFPANDTIIRRAGSYCLKPVING
jgi:hypothetical protein